jgi:hypothetical protein
MGTKKSRRGNAAIGRQYASVAEEAARLGVGETLLLEACRERRFPHRRLGRRILLLPDESDSYLEESGVTVEQALKQTRVET